MLLKLDLDNLIFMISIVVGTVVGIVLLYYSFRRNKFNLPLSLSYLSLSLAMVIVFLINSGLMVEFPFLYRLGNVFGWIFVPMPFLYVACITQNRLLKWKDLIHFIPLLIYLVDYAPILMLSNSQKLTLILSEIDDPNQFTQFQQSRFFPAGFHQTFRTLVLNLYWVLQLLLFFRWKKQLMKPESKFERDWQKWMIFFLSFQVLIFFPFYLTFFYLESSQAFTILHFNAAIFLLTSGIILSFFPKILYGLDEIKFISDQIVKDKDYDRSIKDDTINFKKMEKLETVINKWIIEKKVYLRHGYSIQDLARDADVPYYLISNCISRHLGKNFSDLMNEKRIDYSKQILHNGDFSNFTLEAIANECGFSNRNSFSTAFKKYTGTTPSQYLKTIKD